MSEDGRREVLIVYRARRDDWTFAKGKRRCDEVDAACARREVEEETGLRCVLGPELPPQRPTAHAPVVRSGSATERCE